MCLFRERKSRQIPREIFRRLIFSTQDFWLNRYTVPGRKSDRHSLNCIRERRKNKRGTDSGIWLSYTYIRSRKINTNGLYNKIALPLLNESWNVLATISYLFLCGSIHWSPYTAVCTVTYCTVCSLRKKKVSLSEGWSESYCGGYSQRCVLAFLPSTNYGAINSILNSKNVPLSISWKNRKSLLFLCFKMWHHLFHVIFLFLRIPPYMDRKIVCKTTSSSIVLLHKRTCLACLMW